MKNDLYINCVLIKKYFGNIFIYIFIYFSKGMS